VFTAGERTEAAHLAREDAIRHPAPSKLERAVADVKEGTAIGVSLIAHAASSSVSRLRKGATAVTRAVLSGIGAVVGGTFSLVGRSLRAIGRAVGAVGAGMVTACLAIWRMLLKIVAAVTGAVLKSSGAVIGGTVALVTRSTPAIATAASAAGGGMIAGSRGVWRAALKVATGIVLVTLAIGLGLAALIVGLIGAARTGIVLLAGATATAARGFSSTTQAAARGVSHASGTALVAARRADARAVVAATRAVVAATRASVVSRQFLSRGARDLAGLRVTIRWHAHTAGPIVGALADAFGTQLGQSIRRAQPRHAVAAVGVAVFIAAIYGAPRRDRSAAGATPAAPASTASQPALASVAPTAVADAALADSLTGRSAPLPAPLEGPQAKPSSKVATTAEREQAVVGKGTAPARSMLGTLLIASAPKGAKVTIDGIPRGHSPLSVTRLRAGNRMVRLELDGYQRWSWAVYVSASRETRLNVALVPDSAPSRSSAVTNTAAAAK
jgi:hypothetical protein